MENNNFINDFSLVVTFPLRKIMKGKFHKFPETCREKYNKNDSHNLIIKKAHAYPLDSKA